MDAEKEASAMVLSLLCLTPHQAVVGTETGGAYLDSNPGPFERQSDTLSLCGFVCVQVTRTDQQCRPLQLQFHDAMVNDLAVSEDGRDIISLSDSLGWWRLAHEGRTERDGRIHFLSFVCRGDILIFLH